MTASWQTLPLVLGVVLGLLAVSGQADVDPRATPLRAVFYPYRQGPAQVDGITPGLRLDRTTFQLARAVLPAELLQYGLAGDFAVTVQPTTDMPLRAEYIAALTRLGVTIVSTVAVEEDFTSMDLSNFTVSFLADDIMRLRYVSINGQLRKILLQH